MVQGDPFKAGDKNMKGAPLTDKKGDPRVEYFFAIAIPKTSPEWLAFKAQIDAIALASWPAGQSALPDFSWKIVDGDAPKNSNKEGFAGHWIIRCSNGFPIEVFTAGGTALVLDKSGLKRGDWIRAYIQVVSNCDATYPGLYVNPSMIEVVGFGEEIKGGPDGAQVFGGNAAVLPAGVSATPVGSTTTIAQTNTVVPPQQNTVATAATTVAPPPATTVAPPPATTVAAPVKTMTAKANGIPYDQYIAQKWTDELLIEQGYMILTAAGVVQDATVLN